LRSSESEMITKKHKEHKMDEAVKFESGAMDFVHCVLSVANLMEINSDHSFAT